MEEEEENMDVERLEQKVHTSADSGTDTHAQRNRHNLHGKTDAQRYIHNLAMAR